MATHCLNSEGAYAAIAGGEAVDVSAVLFPIWDFVKADAPEVKATLRVLERDYCKDNLYWRHLESFDSKKEGAFLAGTIWVAQYWVMRNGFARVESILNAALEYSGTWVCLPKRPTQAPDRCWETSPKPSSTQP